MGRKKISITEIAKQFGISPSTVSRAMNNQPGVSEQLRQQILRYMEECGYRAPVLKQQESEAKSKMIAMIVGDIRNPFYADLVFSVQKTLSENGYLLSIFNSEYEEQRELQFMHLAESYRFAGIIQVTVTTERMSTALKSLSIPVVMVNRMLNTFDTDVVLLDNYEAGYIATRHLIEQGHSRIGFLLGQMESSSSIKRYEGYLQAVKNYNLSVREADILPGDLTMPTAYNLAKDFCANLKNNPEDAPTAMVVSNDLAAYGFMRGCREMGVEVPKMLSIVSFDNIWVSSIGDVQLTTVDPHVTDMGRIAAELMLSRINRPNKEAERVVLSPVLIERDSTIPYRDSTRK